jgi:hypothetical protein
MKIIDKYFEGPTDIVFDSLTYSIYHRKFKYISTIPSLEFKIRSKIELLLNEKKKF